MIVDAKTNGRISPPTMCVYINTTVICAKYDFIFLKFKVQLYLLSMKNNKIYIYACRTISFYHKIPSVRACLMKKVELIAFGPELRMCCLKSFHSSSLSTMNSAFVCVSSWMLTLA